MKNSNYKIMFVDDDVLIHKMAKSFLAEWDVDYFFSGDDALELLEKENYAVVITDIQMPGEDGISLLKKIRANYSATQVIIITASLDVENLLETLEAGANDFILKPLTKEKLLTSLENSIEKLQRWRLIFKELFKKRKLDK